MLDRQCNLKHIWYDVTDDFTRASWSFILHFVWFALSYPYIPQQSFPMGLMKLQCSRKILEITNLFKASGGRKIDIWRLRRLGAILRDLCHCKCYYLFSICMDDRISICDDYTNLVINFPLGLSSVNNLCQVWGTFSNGFLDFDKSSTWTPSDEIFPSLMAATMFLDASGNSEE